MTQYRLPTVREYEILRSGDVPAAVSVAHSITGFEKVSDCLAFIPAYIAFLDDTRKNTPQLNAPYLPKEDTGIRYSCSTGDMKLVSDYTRHTFGEIWDMDIFTYWSYLHDAVVYSCMQSESGRDYLEECWVHSQTKPDRDRINSMEGGWIKRGRQ